MLRNRAALVTVFQGAGDTVLTIRPDSTTGQDTNVAAGGPTANFGGVDALIIRKSGGVRNGLMKFDLSSIPATATILSAKLYLYAQAQIASEGSFVLNSILAANDGWTELGAVWNTKDGVNAWAGDAAGDGGADAGCSIADTDYNSTQLGAFTYVANDPEGTEYIISLDISQVEAWLTANYGFVVRQPTGTAANYSFHTSEATTVSQRPKLVITYRP